MLPLWTLLPDNSVVVIADSEGKQVYQKRLPNDLGVIQKALEPYKSNLSSVVLESTFNWYWLIDGLMAGGYQVYLANTSAIQQYKGIKHTNDYTDAHWLAELLRLKLLPVGYIYPKEERGLRDLLRKRGRLVQQRTQNILSLQNIILRETAVKVSGDKLKKLNLEELDLFLKDKNVKASAVSNLKVIKLLSTEIVQLEKNALKQMKLKPEFNNLRTVPGIGKILALSIALETGDINRFKNVGNFASYCSYVDSKRISNGKKKGENNRKNGNKYLAWLLLRLQIFLSALMKKLKNIIKKR